MPASTYETGNRRSIAARSIPKESSFVESGETNVSQQTAQLLHIVIMESNDLSINIERIGLITKQEIRRCNIEFLKENLAIVNQYIVCFSQRICRKKQDRVYLYHRYQRAL
jgi:hypothetical protein